MKRDMSRGNEVVITLNLLCTVLITQTRDISLTDNLLHGK